jgi:hypothetical protein
MTGRALLLVLAAALAAPTAPHVAFAQEAAPSDAARAEARERFDRGLRLFNAGDNAGALVEFRRAYELVANVVVLFNIGLVYAQMGRAVEATDALDRALASPGTLSPERLSLARQTRDEQAARIAEVGVEANVEGARVEVDGIEATQTPLAAPLRVPGGTHVIGVVAAGFTPQRKEIAIAGGEKKTLKFELVAMQGRLAHVAVKTHVPGAEVFVDDQVVGRTPLASSVTLAPGPHRIELRRPGYTTAGADVSLTDGAAGEVTLEPAEDPAALVASGGELALDISETLATVTVDGHPRGAYLSALHLSQGPHHVIIERGDFTAAERDVTIDPGHTTTVRVVLDPTPEYRTRYASRARSQRTWGLVGIVGGAVVLGGGVALVAYDASQRNSANAQLVTLKAAVQLKSGSSCDPSAQDSTTPQYAQRCLAPITAASNNVNDANTRDYFAWSAIGVGAAALAVGFILRLTADDPSKYDEARPEVGLTVRPEPWSTPGGGGVALVGAF